MAKKKAAKNTKKKAAKKKAAKRKAKPPSEARKRLRAAFAELNENGIVALENAGYTQSDGWGDTNEVAYELKQRGLKPRGGCFYHQQDSQRGRKGEGLYLTFGAYAQGKRREASTLEVGREIVATLERHGFTPAWDGTSGERIHTGRFSW